MREDCNGGTQRLGVTCWVAAATCPSSLVSARPFLGQRQDASWWLWQLPPQGQRGSPSISPPGTDLGEEADGDGPLPLLPGARAAGEHPVNGVQAQFSPGSALQPVASLPQTPTGHATCPTPAVALSGHR